MPLPTSGQQGLSPLQSRLLRWGGLTLLVGALLFGTLFLVGPDQSFSVSLVYVTVALIMSGVAAIVTCMVLITFARFDL